MKNYPTFILEDKIYNVNDIDSLLTDVKIVKTSKGIQYLNVSVSFDIETTSFYRKIKNHNDIVVDKPSERSLKYYEKCNTMYAWVFGFNGKHIIGRTWDEFMMVLDRLIKKYKLNDNKRCVIYIHNLSYEFQYLRKRFEWLSIFALEQREPVKAISLSGIEYRCSYLLSGYSLAYLGDNILHKYKVKKMVGDLDYSKLRHCKTPLTDKELGYILHDGMVVSAYIQEMIEQYKNIARIPLTKTGIVRRHCRNKCLGGYKSNLREVHNFKRLISSITIEDVEEYKQLKRAFHGGFTHANAFRVNKVIKYVGSCDFTSSYPAVMLMEKYPMSKAQKTIIHSRDELEYYLKNYCCVFDISFYNLKMKNNVYENPLSFSKCIKCEKPIVNNGRVVQAEEVLTTITNVDFDIYKAFYSWDKIRIYNFRYYRKAYLPKSFILAILDMYEKKTTLKGVKGKEVEYMNSKENLNSCYGMGVTDICKDETTYSGGVWGTNPVDIEKALNKYNTSINRFLCYQWGIFVTAYAMRNLFTGIYEFKEDYIYSDTDSIKGTNFKKHIGYFTRYNNKVREKLTLMCKHYDIDIKRVEPLTKNGKSKLIGVWDYEGTYYNFKTLGAKRYITKDKTGIHLTCSGLNKKVTTPYLIKTYGSTKEVFNAFNQNLFIPKNATGKNIHTYIDDEKSGILTDYLGTKAHYYESSSVHMEGAEYDLSITDEFIDYLLGIKDVYEN